MQRENEENKYNCPKCGSNTKQMKSGFTCVGSQRILCGCCNCKYTPKQKPRIYPVEVRAHAIKEYYAGVSGRGVAKLYHMDKSNVYRWIAEAKKNGGDVGK